MQSEATDAFDIRKEPESVREEYGDTPFANGCLLARRLVERGVRTCTSTTAPASPGTTTAASTRTCRGRCPDMDQAAAALIRDLKRRGLLDETAVVWGGEFGRTPVSESGDGRDHNPYGFTMWMAGGGFKGGIVLRRHRRVRLPGRGEPRLDPRPARHAAAPLGIDHEKLTYRYAGRDFRLTDVYGEVVHDILA